MSQTYLLSCESTADLPFSHVTGRDISVLFYSCAIDGVEYPDDMGRDPQTLPRLYGAISQGKTTSTSQINPARYADYFRSLLEKGDVLHVAFSSGLTGSVNNARLAAEEVRAEFPQRKIVVVDSRCASCGYGLLMEEAADRRDAGATLEELAQWLETSCLRVHHHFFSSDLTVYRRSGRLKGPAAAMASILGICPIMRVDLSGHLVAYDKVRGKKAAFRRMCDVMEKSAAGGSAYTDRIFIGHTSCPQDAEEMRAQLAQRFPNCREIRVMDIGLVIGSHCGQGTVAAFCWSEEERGE